VWDIVLEEKAIFFSNNEGKDILKYGIDKDIYVYNYRFVKINGHILNIVFYNIFNIQN
jgi:hypothetical protein